MKNENQRSAAHAAASGVRMNDMHGADFAGIEEIKLVEPDDWIARRAQLHRANGLDRIRDRAQSLEMELQAEDAARRRAEKKVKPARVPRDTEPCNLVRFLGIVSGGVAAAMIGAALLGWIGKAAFAAFVAAVANIPGVR